MACETHVYILCRRVCCFLAPPSGLRVSSFKRFCSHQWPASRRYLPNGGSAAGSGPPLSKARFSGATAQPDLRATAPMPPTPLHRWHLPLRLGITTGKTTTSDPKAFPKRLPPEQGNSMAWRAQGHRFLTCVGVIFSVKRCVQNL